MNTFLGHLELSALGHLDRLNRFVAGALGHVLDLVDNLVSLENLAEDDVAAIEPASYDGGNARVGHAEETLAGVLELEVLIGEFGAIDGLSAGTVMSREVTFCASLAWCVISVRGSTHHPGS
jgi:hypothetical protein